MAEGADHSLKHNQELFRIFFQNGFNNYLLGQPLRLKTFNAVCHAVTSIMQPGNNDATPSSSTQ